MNKQLNDEFGLYWRFENQFYYQLSGQLSNQLYDQFYHQLCNQLYDEPCRLLFFKITPRIYQQIRSEL